MLTSSWRLALVAILTLGAAGCPRRSKESPTTPPVQIVPEVRVIKERTKCLSSPYPEAREVLGTLPPPPETGEPVTLSAEQYIALDAYAAALLVWADRAWRLCGTPATAGTDAGTGP